MSWSQVTSATPARTEPSPLDSARFGRSVERLTVGGGDDGDGGDGAVPFAAVAAAIRESAADVIVLRYPARRMEWFARLLALGRTVLLADSLVYWRLEAGRGRQVPPVPGLWTEPLRDPAAVEPAVLSIFAGYRSHYLANPLFGDADVIAGYAEWARGSAVAGDCLGLLRAAPGVGGPRVAGLATVADDGPSTEILLAGVMPREQGRGRYAHILRAVEERTLARGGTQVVISTQGHHTSVQRAWARYGFEPVLTLLTVHLLRAGLCPS
ncbi:hypothetical protein Sme01_09570 [Sphaerisporangium melleum]|uniref:N-acetyltransferase domain-containing protein n=1 Tax=Sphaerisporangium melleum TaxID=321316 RepID=A0A917QU21_9ACTN|nr:N-acetyltransferase [Sphaerisporangium melleum]GGK67386.1 hypothetical protein GCM10007964_08040 [Sphaerisporangium melleum]GII68481.1 hypothetical protein Sme01_09570 [Sphaerisporangium melleum]